MENAAEPKERILSAALELFSEKGFKATTIREICKEADVSLALVNYHFRNKQALYDEIVLGSVETAFRTLPVEDFIKDGMTPHEKLRHMIRLIMHRLMGPKGIGTTRAKVRLLAREITNPTDTMETIFENRISTMIRIVGSVVKELAGDMPQEDVMRFVSSIAGQCMHPLLARDLLIKAGLEINSTEADIEKHAEHIYKFSINGILNYNGEPR